MEVEPELHVGPRVEKSLSLFLPDALFAFTVLSGPHFLLPSPLADTASFNYCSVILDRVSRPVALAPQRKGPSLPSRESQMRP